VQKNNKFLDHYSTSAFIANKRMGKRALETAEIESERERRE
jgi:hypothetical protein